MRYGLGDGHVALGEFERGQGLGLFATSADLSQRISKIKTLMI